MRGVHNSNDDALRASTITPCDLRSSGLIANLVTSAADTRAMGIGRLADLQTALFESYIDLVESVQADSIRVDVDKCNHGSDGRHRPRVDRDAELPGPAGARHPGGSGRDRRGLDRIRVPRLTPGHREWIGPSLQGVTRPHDDHAS